MLPNRGHLASSLLGSDDASHPDILESVRCALLALMRPYGISTLCLWQVSAPTIQLVEVGDQVELHRLGIGRAARLRLCRPCCCRAGKGSLLPLLLFSAQPRWQTGASALWFSSPVPQIGASAPWISSAWFPLSGRRARPYDWRSPEGSQVVRGGGLVAVPVPPLDFLERPGSLQMSQVLCAGQQEHASMV